MKPITNIFSRHDDSSGESRVLPRTVVSRLLPKITFAVLFLAIWLPAANSFAHAPMSRQAEATIETVDKEHRLITAKLSHQSKPTVLAWNKSTQFVQDGKLVLSDSVKAGEIVQISYRSPFFGKPILTKIVWQEPVQAPLSPKKL